MTLRFHRGQNVTYLFWMQATSAQEESQRMTAVRKAYQRAVLAPIHLVEQLWKDYENFENSVSRALVLYFPCILFLCSIGTSATLFEKVIFN